MNIISYNEILPTVHPSVFIAPNATLIGRVLIQEESSVWYQAVLRADLNGIEIGKQSNLQEGVCIHVTSECPTKIGNGVTVGHGAILHGCEIQDNALIGMGAIILDGAIIEEGALVAAGCVVPPRKVVPARHLVMGNPMRVVRILSEGEIEHQIKNAELYVQLAKDYQLMK